MKETFATHALPFVLQAEGGFSDDPGDAGGATCMGIEQGEYDTHRKACGLPVQSVRYITTSEAANIYHDHYWAPIQGDDLPYPIDWITFDAAVNMGVGTAAKMLAEALDLPPCCSVNGSVVAKAQSACSTLRGAHEVKDSELSERLTVYHEIVERHSNDAKFLHGWLIRVANLRAQS